MSGESATMGRRRAAVAEVMNLPFGPGDALFEPAGVEHRFEGFTNDLVVWAVFYGPEGGEAG